MIPWTELDLCIPLRLKVQLCRHTIRDLSGNVSEIFYFSTIQYAIKLVHKLTCEDTLFLISVWKWINPFVFNSFQLFLLETPTKFPKKTKSA